MSRTNLWLLWLLVCAAVPTTGWSQAQGKGYRLIVNSKNPVTSLPREKVAAYYLKKSTTWEHGGAVQPVDLPDENSTRKTFSEEVLKKSLTAVKAYWQQRIFSGRDVPPAEKPSDAEVVAYVKANERALGYVSDKADVAEVKVVAVTE